MTSRARRRSLLVAVLSLSASMGCTGSVGQAGPTEPGPQAVNVAVTPGQVDVPPSAQVPFAAVVTGTANTTVTWGVQEPLGGTVTATGVYTAPASGGTFHVTATSQADTTKQGVATVTVTAPPPPPPPPPPVAVTVSPATGSVDECRTLQLTATVTGTTNTAVTWSVQEGAAGGSVATNGLYTAPNGPGTYHAVATSVADPTKSATATLSVVDHVLSVVVAPATVSVAPGGTAQFTATVTNTCGVFNATRIVAASPSGEVTVR